MLFIVADLKACVDGVARSFIQGRMLVPRTRPWLPGFADLKACGATEC